MTVQHIIWDWNGTLLNDVEACCVLSNAQLVENGLDPLTLNDYRTRVFHPIEEFYRSIGFDFQKKTYEQLSREFHLEYAAVLPSLRLQQGVPEILGTLQYRGVSQSILSAHPEKLLHISVAQQGIEQFFLALVGLEHERACSKVERGRAWMAAARLNASEVLLIGDTDHDAEVADALGISCVLVSHGFQSRDRLERTGYPTVTSLSEVLSLIPVQPHSSSHPSRPIDKGNGS